MMEATTNKSDLLCAPFAWFGFSFQLAQVFLLTRSDRLEALPAFTLCTLPCCQFQILRTV